MILDITTPADIDTEPSASLLDTLRDNIDDEALIAIIDELASRQYQL